MVGPTHRGAEKTVALCELGLGAPLRDSAPLTAHVIFAMSHLVTVLTLAVIVIHVVKTKNGTVTMFAPCLGALGDDGHGFDRTGTNGRDVQGRCTRCGLALSFHTSDQRLRVFSLQVEHAGVSGDM